MGGLHLLITGRPGIGKTTLVKKTVEELKRRSIGYSGFITEEVREQGVRQGFKIRGLPDGREGVLAWKGLDSRYRVGKYGVDIETFESIALPALEATSPVLIVDEIGRMELFSKVFRRRIKNLLRGTKPLLLATIQEKSLYLLDEWNVRNRVKLIRIERKGDRKAEEEVFSWIRSLTL